MKKIVVVFVLFWGVFTAYVAYSVEFVREDEIGYKYYRCLSTGSGVTRVKKIAKNRFVVLGGSFSGKINAPSAVDAARYSCDRKPRTLNRSAPAE